MAAWYLFYKLDGTATVISAMTRQQALEMLEIFSPELIGEACMEFDHNPSTLEEQLTIRFAPTEPLKTHLDAIVKAYQDQSTTLTPAVRARKAYALVFKRQATLRDGHVLYDIVQLAKETL